MNSKVINDLGPEDPHLIYLRGKFHKVPLNAGPSNARVLHLGKESMKSMTELMKKSGQKVEREKRWLTSWWFYNIKVINDYRKLPKEEVLANTAAAEFCAPACALV